MKGLSGDSESTSGGREASSAEEASRAQVRACPACGARARRPAARFCATCGRGLGGGYFPTDLLRASYRFEPEPAQRARTALRAPRRLAARGGPARRVGREFMPRVKESTAAATALAFVTYGLVPYLGILFCPGALVCGGVGLLRAWRSPQPGHARASALGLGLGLLVLCAQLLLWWILYKVPDWSRQSHF
jgi:hypothetical protein